MFSCRRIVNAVHEVGRTDACTHPTPREPPGSTPGLAALADGGPDAVRVDVLAQTLGVTRGGFYHQFDDRQALLDELLDAWERRSTDEVLERVEREGGDARTKVTQGGPADVLRRVASRRPGRPGLGAP